MSQDARKDDEQSAQRRAQILGMTYTDTSFGQKQLYPDILSKAELYQLKVIPLQADAHFIHFGVTTTTSQQTMQMLRSRFQDQRLAFSIISDVGYRDYMKLYDPPKKIEYTDISIADKSPKAQIDQVSATLEQVRADDMLAYLVQQAHRLTASDIHLENQPDKVRIRFRIDGVLHTVANLTEEKFRVLRAAIASAGNISTSSEEAQQGHIAQAVKMADGADVQINLRLETVPAINGMDIVMRLFNMEPGMYTLERLSLSAEERAVVDDIIKKPSGLVMVVGPTGSGKTTTLYSMLNSLNSDERKIITIEDPVEYQFPGITQISVTTKNSQTQNFADKLRAVLRLDPDVVMIGEIRDMDTAKTALQASLTGHLVLSTFHASSAAAALTRLADIIGQNPLFVSAIRLVMAQRLVRRLDDSSKQPYQPDEATKQKIQLVIDTLPEGIQRPSLDGLTLYKPVASAGNPYGFKGQVPLREQFLMTGKIREMLENTTADISTHALEEAAVASGMRTMLQDGILKVVAGETTLEEIYRVVG